MQFGNRKFILKEKESMAKKVLKRNLFTSLVALSLSTATLIGTTFAWFTDNVTSSNNVIVAGNLDAEVYYGDPSEKNSIQSVNTLFNAVKDWEPGAVAYENLTVANEGSLAFKYEMAVNFTDENYVIDGGYKLSQVLKVGIVSGGVAEDATREEALAAMEYSFPMKDFAITNSLEAYTNEETIGVVIYWEQSAEDNNYNTHNGKQTSDGKPLHISLGIVLRATQYTLEEDSFDKNYDKEATFPQLTTGTLREGAMEDLSLTIGAITVKVPKSAPYGEYALEVNDYSATIDENDETKIATNFALKKDGVTVAEGAADYKVIIQIEPMSKDIELYHYQEKVNHNYDVYTGELSFTTNSFSPFAVEYTVFGKEVDFVEAEDGTKKIIRGFFRNVNPVTDPMLDGIAPEYIAVDCVKDGN